MVFTDTAGKAGYDEFGSRWLKLVVEVLVPLQGVLLQTLGLNPFGNTGQKKSRRNKVLEIVWSTGPIAKSIHLRYSPCAES